MTRIPDNLGCQILWSTTEGIRLAVIHFLRKAKVDKLEVALGVDEDVLGLEVAVRHSLGLVQELEN